MFATHPFRDIFPTHPPQVRGGSARHSHPPECLGAHHPPCLPHSPLPRCSPASRTTASCDSSSAAPRRASSATAATLTEGDQLRGIPCSSRWNTSRNLQGGDRPEQSSLPLPIAVLCSSPCCFASHCTMPRCRDPPLPPCASHKAGAARAEESEETGPSRAPHTGEREEERREEEAADLSFKRRKRREERGERAGPPHLSLTLLSAVLAASLA